MTSRLVVVSNRLPVTIERQAQGVNVRPSSGGLVSALLPVFRAHGGTWVGWPGTGDDPEVARALRQECAPGCSLEPVFLTPTERDCFYHGCSNEVLWPLLHDLQSRCNFDPGYWSGYCEVTEKYADAVERVLGHREPIVWVHDYHLMMLADSLRARQARACLAYFHHVPFPSPDIFEKLPWRTEVLRGLLAFHTLGFQTSRDRRNFVACVRRLLPGTRLHRLGGRLMVRGEDRCSTLLSAPIGIDYPCFSAAAAGPAVEQQVAELRAGLADSRVILGLDRLDYTKGIPERLAAFRFLLHAHPHLRGRVALLQVVVPSREDIPSYRRLREEIERQVSAINGEFGQPAWTPVRYVHRTLSQTELLAYYRVADVALVTPLKDGMNLVAKEFCAARNDEQGVLVLSEFAGAAEELKVGAVLVNPYDTESVASRLEHALAMPSAEQRRRMQRMRAIVAGHDVFRWCSSLLGRLEWDARDSTRSPAALPSFRLAAPA